MSHANVVLNFNAFLEETKLKDDGSNYTDWVRKLRIVLIAAQKAYVLNAPLGVLNLSVVCRCCETSDIHVLMTT